MRNPTLAAVEASLPLGLVQISAQKILIVRTGVLGGTPLSYAVEGEPSFRSLEKALVRLRELQAEKG